MSEMPDWLVEVLHVVAGVAAREHEGPVRTLVAAHVGAALSNVPAEVLQAAGLPGAVARA